MTRKRTTGGTGRPAGGGPAALPVIGWREWVGLPGLGVERVKAKIDTGARSSALHAFDLRIVRRRGVEYVQFTVHPIQRDGRASQPVTCPLVGHRRVRSSNGILQERPVVRTEVELLGRRWLIDLTLTRRDVMGFRMLLGREAVRGRFLIHAGRSFLGSRRDGRPRSKPRIPRS